MKNIGYKYLATTVVLLTAMFVSAFSAFACCCEAMEVTAAKTSCHGDAANRASVNSDATQDANDIISTNFDSDGECGCDHAGKFQAFFDAKEHIKKGNAEPILVSAASDLELPNFSSAKDLKITPRNTVVPIRQIPNQASPRAPPIL